MPPQADQEEVAPRSARPTRDAPVRDEAPTRGRANARVERDPPERVDAIEQVPQAPPRPESPQDAARPRSEALVRTARATRVRPAHDQFTRPRSAATDAPPIAPPTPDVDAPIAITRPRALAVSGARLRPPPRTPGIRPGPPVRATDDAMEHAVFIQDRSPESPSGTARLSAPRSLPGRIRASAVVRDRTARAQAPTERPARARAKLASADPPNPRARGKNVDDLPITLARGKNADDPPTTRTRGKNADDPPTIRARGKDVDDQPITRARRKNVDDEPITRARGKNVDDEPITRTRGKNVDDEPITRARGKNVDAEPITRARGKAVDDQPRARGKAVDDEPGPRAREPSVDDEPPSRSRQTSVDDEPGPRTRGQHVDDEPSSRTPEPSVDDEPIPRTRGTAVDERSPLDDDDDSEPPFWEIGDSPDPTTSSLASPGLVAPTSLLGRAGRLVQATNDDPMVMLGGPETSVDTGSSRPPPLGRPPSTRAPKGARTERSARRGRRGDEVVLGKDGTPIDDEDEDASTARRKVSRREDAVFVPAYTPTRDPRDAYGGRRDGRGARKHTARSMLVDARDRALAHLPGPVGKRARARLAEVASGSAGGSTSPTSGGVRTPKLGAPPTLLGSNRATGDTPTGRPRSSSVRGPPEVLGRLRSSSIREPSGIQGRARSGAISGRPVPVAGVTPMDHLGTSSPPPAGSAGGPPSPAGGAASSRPRHALDVHRPGVLRAISQRATSPIDRLTRRAREAVAHRLGAPRGEVTHPRGGPETTWLGGTSSSSAPQKRPRPEKSPSEAPPTGRPRSAAVSRWTAPRALVERHEQRRKPGGSVPPRNARVEPPRPSDPSSERSERSSLDTLARDEMIALLEQLATGSPSGVELLERVTREIDELQRIERMRHR